ncbi:putative phosphoglucomutase [Clostridiales bacterium 1_7_47FAA]|nr:putative phosphoglucomutase [Clostridiales bacterium 1_7_47FAA]
MNIYTVAKVSQGYADYLSRTSTSQSIAIAYDSRINSEVFARTAAEVFAANGIKVYIYKELMPTPALSFAIRYLGCSGGVVITASHNPSKYNGYKVYGADGCQITTDVAKDILEYINRVDIFLDIKKRSFTDALIEGSISFIEEEVIDKYIAAVSSESLSNVELNENVSIVYTPLNGAGRYCVTRVLRENGYKNIVIVKEQEFPDGSFPTCPYPNPEISDAMKLGIDYAIRTESELVLATDPDCDRVGIAVKNGPDYKLLTGNETGMLLLDYICKQRNMLGTMPNHPVAFKSIVTIDMAIKIAEYYGVEMQEVLTGFKFIGEQIGYLEEKGEKERFIFGFEESYGYLSGTYVRDKDGVNASLLICEMFAYYKEQGKTLLEVLNSLYAQFGYCLNSQRCYQFEGVEGLKKMNMIMQSLREERLAEIAGRRVLAVKDYKKSIIKYQDNTEEVIYLPKSNVLKFILEGNSSIVVRPSGTEPKMKAYFSVSAETQKKAEALRRQMEEECDDFFMII